MPAQFEIAGRPIGPEYPTYVIAEISANHQGRFEDAERLVRLAKEIGADAVKLQTYTPDTITLDCEGPPFVIGPGTIWEGRRLYDLYAEAYTPWEWQPLLKKIADEVGITLFSSPFDQTAVEFLEGMQVPAYKIASFELVDHDLIARCAATGKPLIMSTGMASVGEIAEAVEVARRRGAEQLALLHCNSAYPAPAAEMNLRTVPFLAEAFGVVSGLSDHTLGHAAAVASVALGGRIIEKHITLSRHEPGPDSAFSLEPEEFRALIAAVREAEQALGGVKTEPTPKEVASRAFRRSLFVVRDVKAGEPFTRENVRSVRPADGLEPKHLDFVLTRQARRNLKRGEPLTWEGIA